MYVVFNVWKPAQAHTRKKKELDHAEDITGQKGRRRTEAVAGSKKEYTSSLPGADV
jgi:hypothetical protein